MKLGAGVQSKKLTVVKQLAAFQTPGLTVDTTDGLKKKKKRTLILLFSYSNEKHLRSGLEI